MSVTIKTAHEIELMREAGRLLNIVHKELEAAIRPGISTWELDKLGERVIRSFREAGRSPCTFLMVIHNKGYGK